EVIRETYASSLEVAAAVLEALGETPASAREAVRRFRQYDQKTLQAQYQVKEDEQKFLATSLAAAHQLERLFEADTARADARAPHGGGARRPRFLVRQTAFVCGGIQSADALLVRGRELAAAPPTR